MPTIVLIGGGTAGHVTPNIALLPALRDAGYDVHYIGTRDGIEQELIAREGIPYYAVPAGKLRRYLDWQNFTDLARIKFGFLKSLLLLVRIRPDIIFSKGGFVTPPIIWAAWLLGIPVVCHESDLTPGLANKLSLPFAKRICYAFAETAKYLPAEKAVHTGIPVRTELGDGDAQRGRDLCAFSSGKPVVLVMGGSLGSRAINEAVRAALPDLLAEYQICHLCGHGNLDSALEQTEGYAQFEYVADDLPHLFAAADFVVSRAGATALFEFLSLQKPALLIPLSLQASRGDQIDNARAFRNAGYSLVLSEEGLTPDVLCKAIRDLRDQSDALGLSMSDWHGRDAVAEILSILADCLNKN
ncbi:MAG: undecaprenyldiphospho-muramoylpentapeptide beta-N-acetylglucosaminyltransferase [Gemmatimonadetes bacterium]|nr:undecaprenyldiphospho-muramoylpentapeptide beta-N-acetylglucosaminyltransferase [Gemmatimonadota bacterium]